MNKRFKLLDTQFFLDNKLVYKRDKFIGDGYFVNNNFVKKYIHGYHSVSMQLYLKAIHSDNYYSVLRRKVLELYFLNRELYYDNHKLFITVIENINNVMRITTMFSVNRDIGQFIDDVLDEVNWEVKLEDLNSVIRYFKPMPNIFNFDDKTDIELNRYRLHINKFNGELKSKDTMNRLQEAITELGISGEWINPESISDKTEELFKDRVTERNVIHLIREHELKEVIKGYNQENYGTTHERTKETVRTILEAATRIKTRGEEATKRALAEEADIHLRTLNRKLDEVPLLHSNLGWG